MEGSVGPNLVGHTWTVFALSFWHVLLPGHVKTVLIAARLGGVARRQILSLAAGFAFSHGLLMALALYGGRSVDGWLSESWGGTRLLVANGYIPVLLPFLQRVDPGMMLHVLALPGPETTLSPDQYTAFLGKLHDYTPGFLRRENGTVHVELWLKGHFEPEQLRIFEHFLDKTSAQINDRLPRHKERIHIALYKPSLTV